MQLDSGVYVTQPMFQRCLVVCRTSDHLLYLKLFKDVRCDRLEGLLPRIKLRMPDIDRFLLSASLLSASMLTLVRVSQMATGNLGFSRGLTAAIFLTAGLVSVRAWTAVKSNRYKYMAKHQQALYFNNISNNRVRAAE